MLSVRHFGLLIKHLDAVDQRVAMRLDRSRPWTETSLTSLLCDLLDDETEHDEALAYSRKQLMDDLANSDEAMTISCRIDSIEYLPEHERYVTQGDLGLILAYRDRVSGESWERGWLLQAKRAKPSLRDRPAYSADSQFIVDALQHRRIETLKQVVGGDFVRYLLYAPRPRMLRDWDRAKLAQARNGALAEHIFDYAYGQLLFEDVKSGCPTIAAGILLARHENVPGTVASAHAQLTASVWPFSWFVALQFGRTRAGPLHSRRPGGPGSPSHSAWNPVRHDEQDSPTSFPVIPFLRGDHDVVEHVIRHCGDISDDIQDYTFLPSHTMIVEVAPGGTLPG